MLDGVTLLYTFENTTGIGLVWVAWIVFALLIGLTIYCWILMANRRTALHLIVSFIATLLCLFGLIGAFNMKPHTETLYKVTIDQSVSYCEFTYYYEVVDIEGEIYTIREIIHDNYETIPPAPTETDSTIAPTEGTIETNPTWDPDAVG